jgi:uncharacterized membrane protein YphA (DoxX/SURF4 family)
MRTPTLAVAALILLRIVVGLHFFLEGLSHLRDPSWSSAGFRKVAVGPLGDWFRRSLPQTGDWHGTLAATDGRPAAEAAAAWKESLVASWRRALDRRTAAAPLDAAGRAAAEQDLETASRELDAWLDAIADDLTAYRLEVARLATMEARPGAVDIPFERGRVTTKRNQLAGQAAGWMAEADAIGRRLVGRWDAALPSDELRRRAAAAAEPSSLWKADRFVSWSLVTIGASLLVGFLVKFMAVGGATFLASVIASQPFWVAGAQPTYDQWVELAALLVIAALPTGGWSGLDYFREKYCLLTAWCRGVCRGTKGVTR